MGANPTFMSWADAQPALASGAVDGQENPLEVFLAAKINTLGQKFVTKWNYSNDILLFAIAAPVWASWSAADQKIVREAALDAAKQQTALVAEAVRRGRRQGRRARRQRARADGRRDGGLADRDAPAVCALEGADAAAAGLEDRGDRREDAQGMTMRTSDVGSA